MATSKPTEGTTSPWLTLAIPTFNRRLKVKRLLDRLAEIHRLKPWGNDVEIIVSDNASEDGTNGACQRVSSGIPNLRTFRHANNVGFDGNVFECYRQSRGLSMFWLHSDDDLPDLGSVREDRQHSTQLHTRLFAILFQAAGRSEPSAPFPVDADVHIDDAPTACIELVMRFPRSAPMCCAESSSNRRSMLFNQTTLGDGFSFVMLGLSILQHSTQHNSLHFGGSDLRDYGLL